MKRTILAALSLLALTTAARADPLDAYGSSPGDILYRGPAGWTALPPPGIAGFSLQSASIGGFILPSWVAGVPGTGTVTSVGLAMPATFSVGGSPVTGAGTLTATYVTQAANIVFAGPVSGGAASPTFRSLVAADLPLASSSAFGAAKCDNSTITCAGGVFTAVGGGSGSVTSVALGVPASSIFGVTGSPVTTTGTLGLTTTVTSGGLMYGSSATAVSSSAAMTAHGVVVGGGPATAPTSTAVGTAGQVLTSNGTGVDPTFQTVSGTGSVTNVTLAPGLGTSASTYNTGAQAITTTGTIFPQFFYEGHAVDYTVLSTDTAKLLTMTAASKTFTTPNPGAVGSGPFNYGYDGTHSYTVTTAGGTVSIYGCGSPGTSVVLTAPAQLITDGTNYQCIPSGGSGSGTVASSTIGQIPIYTAATTVTGLARFTEQTSNTLDYNVNAGSVLAPFSTDGIHVAALDSASAGIGTDTFNAAGLFYGRRSAGTRASPTATGSGVQLTALCGIGYGTTGYATNSSACVIPTTTQAFTDTANGASLHFQVTANGAAASTRADALVVDQDKSVLPATRAAFNPIALTDVATIAVDASLGNVFNVTIAGNRTLGFPTNGSTSKAQVIVFKVTQDSTGYRTLAMGSGYNPATMPLDPRPNAVTTFTCLVNTALATAQCSGGFNAALAQFTIAAGANGIPTCGADYLGWRVMVTDGAATPLYNVTQTGGGSTAVPVFCDGSAWTNH